MSIIIAQVIGSLAGLLLAAYVLLPWFNLRHLRREFPQYHVCWRDVSLWPFAAQHDLHKRS